MGTAATAGVATDLVSNVGVLVATGWTGAGAGFATAAAVLFNGAPTAIEQSCPGCPWAGFNRAVLTALAVFTGLEVLFMGALTAKGALEANAPAGFNAVGGGIVAVIGGVDSGIEDKGGKSEASLEAAAGAGLSIVVVCSVVLAVSQAIIPKNTKPKAKIVLF